MALVIAVVEVGWSSSDSCVLVGETIICEDVDVSCKCVDCILYESTAVCSV